MIGQGPVPHKLPSPRIFFPALALVGLMLLTACGSSDSEEPQKTARTGGSPCQVNVQTGPWDLFSEFCAATDAGQPPTREQLRAFPELPMVVAWREVMTSRVPAVRIVNWLEFTFSPDDLEGKNKATRDRAAFSRSYTYSMEHRQEIQSRLDSFLAEGVACKVRDEAAYWLDPEQRPDRLEIVFLPSKPELRIAEDRLFVDTGVLQAGRSEQLVRQLTGLLFRTKGFLDGPIATGLEGEAAVAHSLRTMMNEGILGYIEQLPYTQFHPDHPTLGDLAIVPEKVFAKGREAIDLLDTNIPRLAVDSRAMQEHGKNLAATLVASGSLKQGGYGMATCIVANLGRDRLRETVGSPAAFLKTYQEAANMNPSPVPDPYSVPDALPSSMAPLDEAVLTALIRICDAAFEESP